VIEATTPDQLPPDQQTVPNVDRVSSVRDLSEDSAASSTGR
jgi:hypothetical protein